MASNIISTNIDGAFPVAGQDNDTQGFRDNFTNIKTSLATAKTEIEALQTGGVDLSGINDFEFGGTITQALSLNNADVVKSLGTETGTVEIDNSKAVIHTATTSGSITLSFTGWPPIINGVAAGGAKVRFILSVANISHTLTLPIAVSQGLSTIQGINANRVITFPSIGTYAFDFTSVDGGVIIRVEDTNSWNNLSIVNNTITATNTNGGISLVVNGTGVVTTDNLQFDGNTISTTNTNGDLVLATNGTGVVTTDNLQFDGNTISTTNTNGDLVLDTNGTGVIDFSIATQTTVGSAGSATAPPATPTGYLKVKVGGTSHVMPYYAEA